MSALYRTTLWPSTVRISAKSSPKSSPGPPNFFQRRQIPDRPTRVLRKFPNASAATSERSEAKKTKNFEAVLWLFVAIFAVVTTLAVGTVGPIFSVGSARLALLWRLVWRVVVAGTLLGLLRRVGVVVVVCRRRCSA